MIPATLPSPTVGVIELGPLTLHAYALCILAGIAAAIWIGDRRMRDRGGEPGLVLDVAMWAVPFGIVGGRLYHVITTPQPYFGDGGHPVDALKIWQGGLGIWGAIALGALGAWLGLRKEGVGFLTFADAVAPGVVVAQAIGRWGNWFNNEIHGQETDLPWALEIHRWDSSAGRAVVDAAGEPVVLGTFHPTFLYESLFLLALAILLLVVDRRRRLAPGQVLGLYVAGYPVGRIIIEMMRTDAANTILGLRVNIWTSIVVFVLGVVIYVVCGRRDDPGSETKVSDSEKSSLTR
ncbi:prolipoprotein diacylglyceryl transferase [Janibacter hoylei PVAS-1]|uniref:Phosphatidylglycerol--prolipoprotein diacylglyceryl transferase n=1 Tax=Janibacter hoylei PVAS-1 TaxID=1210046 RepID=K1E0X5_9MICO|nr:prolipoprotein diacylglyceryl transferase [Janibacter hoylei]EKA60671.1 prolipoprotein diacylglyceryl transferase [Janibacter hoylei PVAS-1]RWU81550.1 prolipoprotein diacylglyceryl transferase [Janibacter hoylei PVAS-1]